MENGEDILLQRLKEDDIKALEIIFNRYYSKLYKYLLLIFKNQLLVEHIAQDIFIYLWENRKNLKISVSLETYLYSAGRYKAINQIRDAKRREKASHKMAESLDETEKSPVSILEIKEQEKLIEDAISSLPKRCQQIFRLSREEDMSYKEIAEILHVSVNTVERQIAIAFRKLRTLLRPSYFRIFFLF